MGAGRQTDIGRTRGLAVEAGEIKDAKSPRSRDKHRERGQMDKTPGRGHG